MGGDISFIMSADDLAMISRKHRALRRIREILAEFEEQFEPMPDVMHIIDQKIGQFAQDKQDDVEQAYNFLHSLETHQCLDNYMARQMEIDGQIRSTLIKWMAEVIQWFDLPDETFFLSVGYVDQFLKRESVPKDNLQLLGVGAMFLADKMIEEDTNISIHKMAEMLSKPVATRVNEIAKQESQICVTLDFRLLCATPLDFLSIFKELDDTMPMSKGSRSDVNTSRTREMFHLAVRVAEIGMLTYALWQFSPSLIASAAWSIAHYIQWRQSKPSGMTGDHIGSESIENSIVSHWPDTLACFTCYTGQHLKVCATLLLTGYDSVMSQKCLPVIATRKITL